MNKLSEKDLLILHLETLITMYGSEARVTGDEWNHAMDVTANILTKMEEMGFVDLEGYDFGRKNETCKS